MIMQVQAVMQTRKKNKDSDVNSVVDVSIFLQLLLHNARYEQASEVYFKYPDWESFCD